MVSDQSKQCFAFKNMWSGGRETNRGLTTKVFSQKKVNQSKMISLPCVCWRKRHICSVNRRWLYSDSSLSFSNASWEQRLLGVWTLLMDHLLGKRRKTDVTGRHFVFPEACINIKSMGLCLLVSRGVQTENEWKYCSDCECSERGEGFYVSILHVQRAGIMWLQYPDITPTSLQEAHESDSVTSSLFPPCGTVE